MSIYVQTSTLLSYSPHIKTNHWSARAFTHNSSENIIMLNQLNKKIDCKPAKYDSFKTIWSMHLHNEYNIHGNLLLLSERCLYCCCYGFPFHLNFMTWNTFRISCIWTDTKMRVKIVFFGKDKVLWVHKTSLKNEKSVFASVVLFRFIGFAFVLSIFVVIYYFTRKS